MFGQSYQLGGVNSFAQTDLALVGYDSGLETDRSDYVGSIAVGTPIGMTLGHAGPLRRGRASVSAHRHVRNLRSVRATATVTYTNIDAQPIYGSMEEPVR